jgi:WD40 repeat protein
MKSFIALCLWIGCSYFLTAQNIQNTLRHAPLGSIQVKASSDGQKIASWQGNSVKIWDIKTNNAVQTLSHNDKSDVLFSKDLTLMVTHSDTEIHIWDVAKNSIIKTVSPSQFPKLEPVDGVIPSMKFYTFSPDGSKLAIATTHGKIWLWDWKQDKLIQQLDFMAVPADELIFSEDSRYLGIRAMYMKDGATQINIWDLENMKPIMQAGSPHRLLDENFKCLLGNDKYDNTFYTIPFEMVKENNEVRLVKKDEQKNLLKSQGLFMEGVQSSYDNKFIAIEGRNISDNTYFLSVIEIASKKTIFSLSRNERFSSSFIPQQNLIAVGNTKGGIDLYTYSSQLTQANTNIVSNNENKNNANAIKKPVITLVSPASSPATTPGSYVNLIFEVTDIDNVNQINLLCNGKDVNVAPRLKMVKDKMTVTYPLNVEEGVNLFEFGAMNIMGSDMKSVIITFSKTGSVIDPEKKRGQARAIGLISPYDNLYESPASYMRITAESKDGKPIYLKTEKGEKVTHNTQNNNQYQFEVTLREGKNKFELSNGEHSEPLMISYNKQEPKLPQIWAVIVGVSKYQDSKMNLNYADSDAKMMYEFFKSTKGGKLDDNHIVLLTNEQATRANILKEMKSKFSKAFDDDVVILYIAGHGMPEPTGNEVYFLCHDAQKTNLEGTAIAQSDIQKMLIGTRAKKKIWFADACHSGGMGVSEGLRGAEDEQAYQVNKLLSAITVANKGTALLTASSASETSREAAKWGGGHGVFTHFLVQGLQGEADQNKDGIINIRELYEYTYRNTTSETNGNQHPELKGTFDNRLPLSVIK